MIALEQYKQEQIMIVAGTRLLLRHSLMEGLRTHTLEHLIKAQKQLKYINIIERHLEN